MIWAFKIPLTQHNLRLGMSQKLDRITLKYESSEILFWSHSPNLNCSPILVSKTKGLQLMMDLSPHSPLPLLLWRCIMNQLTCHSAVSRAWLSAAWDLSTNINIPWQQMNKAQHWQILFLLNNSSCWETTLQRQSAEQFYHPIWQLAANSHNCGPRLKVKIHLKHAKPEQEDRRNSCCFQEYRWTSKDRLPK